MPTLRAVSRWIVPFALLPCAAAHPCASCHPREVAGYSHSGMASSLRRPGKEPAGAFKSGPTQFTVRMEGGIVWQRIDRSGEAAEYPVAYVIGSGRHASGYLIQIGDHLFQSPICYYTNRNAYDFAPGYERIADPDFSRPVGEQCLSCHSGRPVPLPGTANRYASPAFLEEAISCARCHGPVEAHLRNPSRDSIVNPAKLPPAARDSVCEQCHLAGVTRVLNPGKSIANFQPGRPLEETFTVYVRPQNRDFRVISHAEQLAQSACARHSAGKLWCGTCHDPHPEKPATAATYNARCHGCHTGEISKEHPAAADCVRCHMVRRQATDGGHTVFTDHRITRRPQPESLAAPPNDDLIAWREPDPALATRNLGLAYVDAGISGRSPAQLVRGYRILADVQQAAPDDVAVLRAIGRTLLLGKHPDEALWAFGRVLELTPGNAGSEEDVGNAWIEAGKLQEAITHLEKAMAIDPLLLTAATSLEAAYRQAGQTDKAEELVRRIKAETSLRPK